MSNDFNIFVYSFHLTCRFIEISTYTFTVKLICFYILNLILFLKVNKLSNLFSVQV